MTHRPITAAHVGNRLIVCDYDRFGFEEQERGLEITVLEVAPPRFKAEWPGGIQWQLIGDVQVLQVLPDVEQAK